MRNPFISLMCAVFLLSSAAAECVTDKFGSVYCAAEPKGGALKDRDGTVNCGKGQCVADSYGSVYCSSVSGGGAAINASGMVFCTVGCEKATTAMCVRGER